MKLYHRFAVLWVGVLGFALTHVSFGGERFEAALQFEEKDFIFSKVEGYDVIYLKDGEISSEVGRPQLPVYCWRIALPAGAEVLGVEVARVDFQAFAGGYSLFPAQPPRILSMIGDVALAQPDPTVYASDDWYPASVVDIAAPITTQDCGQITLLTLRVVPVQYRPKRGALRYVRDLEVRIDYLEREQVRSVSPVVRTIAEVLAGEELPRAPSRERSDAKEYVIITSSGLASAFQPLLDWKRKKGLPDTLVTTEWIYANYSGRDSQEKIRHFLQDVYEDWGIQWLLLGGDVNIVPDRIAWAMDCEAGMYPDENDLSADLYYAALDGDWDANGNSIFGEVDDDVDLMPEIIVGRAPVEDATEAEGFVNKVLTYEKSPNVTYQRSALFFAEILWTDPYTNSGILKDMIDDESMPPRYDPITKLYEHNGNESPSSVINAINQGQCFLNHGGHANYSVMGAGSGYLNRSDMDNLYSPGKYGILASIGCWAAAIDYDAIAEHFVTNPSGGGIGFVGNSRYGWGSPGNPGLGYSEIMDRRFFSTIFNDNLVQPGLALAATKAYYIPYSQTENVYRWHQYQLNLLGEPEMPFWTDYPQDFQVDFPADILTGEQPFVVTVTDAASQPVLGARVCVMMGDVIYEVAKTDAAGQASFTISPATPGTMDVTVTAHNFLPFEGEVTVTSAGSFLAVTDHDFADQNGNGWLEPDETAVLSLTVKNLGTTTCTGISVTLTDCDPFLQILAQDTSFGDLEPGEDTTVTDFLAFAIDDTCSNGLGGHFNLEISDDDSHLWPVIIGVVISTPVLVYVSHEADDPNPNGYPEPGDIVDLTVTVCNEGLADAESVQMVVTSADSYIDFIDSTAAVGAVATGQMGEGVFQLEIDALCPVPHFAPIEVVVSEGTYVFVDSFYLAIGAAGLFDNMEAGQTFWTHSGSGDLWHRSQRNCHSDSTSWYCGDEEMGQYQNNMEASLRSVPFQVAENSAFSFWCQCDFTTYGVDGMYVEISDNGGIDWETLEYIGSGGALPDSLLNIGNRWVKYEYSLSGYPVGQTLQVRFRFKSDGSDVAGGIYVDDVVVTALDDPVLSMDTAPIEMSLLPEQIVWQALPIANVGFGYLDFELDATGLSGPALGGPILAQGGPDLFGHTWIDSDEPGGPVFQWVDISGIGTEVTFVHNDSVVGPFSLGFDVPFYDLVFSEFNISANGWISFTSRSSEWHNQNLPGAEPENLIAPFWDDLRPELAGAHTYYFANGIDSLVVSFVDVPRWSSGGPYTFQVILEKSGLITFNYLSMEEPLNSATVGIQNSTRTDGLAIAYNEAYVTDSLAVQIQRPWLTVTNPMGTLPPFDSTESVLEVNAAGLAEGDYSADLQVTSNDPNASSLVIPVTVIVGAVAPVSDLTVGLDGDDALLRWTAASGADYYRVYRSTTPIFEAAGEPFAVSYSVEWSDSGVLLEPGPYFYLVTAVRE